MMSMIRDRVTYLGLAVLIAWSVGCKGTGSTTNNLGSNDPRIMLLQAKPQAYAIVEATAGDEQARVRLAGLEAAQHAPDAAFELARQGLVDENPAVRFAALVTVGKLRINRLADAALDLTRDDNPSVRAAALFAANRCGREVDLTPLASMLGSGNPSIRANAAMLIGQIGDPQAFSMLSEMAAAPMPRVSPAERSWVRLQFAEAMIRLDPDNPEVLGSLRAAMFSNLDDIRVLSIQILGEVGDKSVQGLLIRTVQRENPIEMQIAAAEALVQMGDRRAVPKLMEASVYDSRALRRELEQYVRDSGGRSGPQVQAVRALLSNQVEAERTAAEVRAQAAVALSWVRTPESANRLSELMNDPDPIVRVAAASAVLRATR